MKKKIAGIVAVLACTVAMCIPTFAGTSYLDVKAGDTYSYATIKDSGAAWDNYFYITPTLKSGNV